MPDRSYIGIDCNENDEWTVVLWTAKKIILAGLFKNTPSELATLVRFISQHCPRPKICLRPPNPSALTLIKFIGDIPDVEVVLMSEAGLRMHQARLSKAPDSSGFQGAPNQAFLLARCAERMI